MTRRGLVIHAPPRRPEGRLRGMRLTRLVVREAGRTYAIDLTAPAAVALLGEVHIACSDDGSRLYLASTRASITARELAELVRDASATVEMPS